MAGTGQTRGRSISERISALRAHLAANPEQQDTSLLGELGTLIFGTRNFEEAVRIFEKVAALEPRNALPVNNIAACYLEMGRFQDVIETADKAIELDPNLGTAYANRADAHRNLGHVQRAAADYQQAVNLDPRNPVLLNKAGACLQLINRYDVAKKHFEAALSVAPRFSLARLNLGLLGLESGDGEQALKRIRDAVSDRNLDEQSRVIGNTALAVLDDHKRLAPHLAESLETGSVDKLQEAIGRTRPQLLSRCSRSTRLMDKLAESARQLEWNQRQFTLAGKQDHVPFLEAAAHCKLDPHVDSLLITHNSLNKGAQLPAAAVERDLPALYQACRDRANISMDEHFEGRGEAWIHYWHARLTAKDSNAFPGQFKPVPNAIGFAEQVPATPPGLVPGTLRHMLNEVCPTVPAGIPRATFLLVVLIQMHAFKDGNGRLARFIFSWQLESQGMHPLIVMSPARRNYVKGLTESRNEQSLQPMLDSLVSTYRDAQQTLNEFNRKAQSL